MVPLTFKREKITSGFAAKDDIAKTPASKEFNVPVAQASTVALSSSSYVGLNLTNIFVFKFNLNNFIALNLSPVKAVKTQLKVFIARTAGGNKELTIIPNLSRSTQSFNH